MVVAALLRSCMNWDCICNGQYKIASCSPFYEPANKPERRKQRQEEWYIWVGSVADDLDLFADWWFFARALDDHKPSTDTRDNKLTLALLVFCIAGTMTWLLEVAQTAIVRPEKTWLWLPLLVLLLEDVPQLVLTFLINDTFEDPSNVAVFNIMTSLYSIIIKVSGELFLNWCYCCEKKDDEAPEADEEEGDFNGDENQQVGRAKVY